MIYDIKIYQYVPLRNFTLITTFSPNNKFCQKTSKTALPWLDVFFFTFANLTEFFRKVCSQRPDNLGEVLSWSFLGKNTAGSWSFFLFEYPA